MITLNKAATRRFPKGTMIKVVSNHIAGQGDQFIGLRGEVIGYCYGDIIIKVDGDNLCFHPDEVEKIRAKNVKK